MRALIVAAALLCSTGLTSASNAFGTQFLEQNSKKDGVTTLPSGLQYRVLSRGHGDSHPTKDSGCLCHYQGQTAEKYPAGEYFDSSYTRGTPLDLAPNQVIAGWTEAMQLMVEGDKWEIYMPSELGYGASGSPPAIPPDSALVFTMELLSINGGKVQAKPRCDVGSLEDCTEREAGFVSKQKGRTPDERAAEAKRLEGLALAKAAPEKLAWVRARLALLKAIAKAGAAKEEL